MKQSKFLALFLTKRLADKCELKDNIKRKDAVNVIYSSRISSKNIDVVLKELESQGLITIVDKHNIKVNKNKLNRFKEWF